MNDEDQYDSSGRILGPNEITRDRELHPDEKGLARAKRLAWEGTKWVMPYGSLLDTVIDQNSAGDLYFTKPKPAQAIHPGLQLVGRKFGLEFNTRIERIPTTEKKGTPNYEGIINESQLHGTSRFNQLKIPSYENRPVYIPYDKLAPFQRGEPLMTTTGGDSSVPDWQFKPFNLKGSQYNKYRSDKIVGPEFDDPQKARSWWSKVTYDRVLDEVLAQGGTKFEADNIFREHRANMKPLNPRKPGAEGGHGLVAAVSRVNQMFQQYNPGIQVRTEKYIKDGKPYFRWTFKDVDGKRTKWDFSREDIEGVAKVYSSTTFAKDHLVPVMDKKRPGGGYFGADNEFNFEILYQFVNIQKSNTTQLERSLLAEQGVPETFSEYINMKLYPQNYEGMFVPQRWKENFQKIVLAEYYEKIKGIKSANKRKTVMNKLVRTWSDFFKDPVNVKGLEMLEEALGQQVAKNMEEGVAAGNEVPSWIGLLRKPPGGWDSKDSWWNDLPKDAKIRYRQMYDYKQRTITPYKRTPQGTKDYEI